ncbi:MAG: DUF983 domain-containing protein [Coraliomargarita sp.]
MNELEPLPKASHREIIARGLSCSCPNCGQAKLFRSLVRIHHSCPKCGMRLERGDGYFLGPLCINYGTIALFYVLPLLLFGVLGWLPIELSLALSLAGALLLPIALYRYSWSWWLMIYYSCLPEELHANRPSECDDLSFEEEKRAR